jgi:hypothetical protein
MNKTQLKETILELFEEIKTETTSEDINEGLSGGMKGLVKYLLGVVKKGQFLRNYDIDTRSGRLMFQTGSGKKIVFNDMKLGVTLNKTWKGKKASEFFSYADHKKMLDFALADI